MYLHFWLTFHNCPIIHKFNWKTLSLKSLCLLPWKIHTKDFWFVKILDNWLSTIYHSTQDLFNIHVQLLTIPGLVHGGYQVELVHEEVLPWPLLLQGEGVVLTAVLDCRQEFPEHLGHVDPLQVTEDQDRGRFLTVLAPRLHHTTCMKQRGIFNIMEPYY